MAEVALVNQYAAAVLDAALAVHRAGVARAAAVARSDSKALEKATEDADAARQLLEARAVAYGKAWADALDEAYERGWDDAPREDDRGDPEPPAWADLD